MRRAVTYLSMDFGDFNFSSCEYHPYREQYPISVALRVHSRRTGHENPLDDDLFSHWYCREPNLCGGRSCRIFSHRLPQLSLLELRGRRLRCGLRHNGGSNWAPRRCLDHLHRRFGHFRWGRVLCAYRRSGHGTPSPKLLEFGVEEFLITELLRKQHASCDYRGSPGEIRTPVSRLLQPSVRGDPEPTRDASVFLARNAHAMLDHYTTGLRSSRLLFD